MPIRFRVPAVGFRGHGAPVALDGVALLLLSLGTLVLASYTLFDLPWQQRLGGWNYIVGIALIMASGLSLRLWQPDPRYRSAPSERPDHPMR